MHKNQEPTQPTDAPIVPSKEEEYLNGWKRALADYENLKKQTAREKEEYAKFANLNLLIGLIPVYDHLVLSFNHLSESFPPEADLPLAEKNNSEFTGWVKGIEHIKKQFKEVLEFNGVEEIEPKVGDDFNPEIHEALENTNKHELENHTPINMNEEKTIDEKSTTGKIKKVLSNGYKMQGRVFKPAKVVVE